MDECRAENCTWRHPHKRFCVHGHDTFEVGRCGNSTCRVCIARHKKSEKGRASEARYRGSEKERAANARYKKSEKGRLTKRIWKGEQSLRELETKYVELVGGSHV